MDHLVSLMFRTPNTDDRLKIQIISLFIEATFFLSFGLLIKRITNAKPILYLSGLPYFL